MSGKVRVIFLSLAVLAFVAGSFFFGTKMNNSASAQATKPRQRTAVVVLGPTGNDKATGTALITISDQNQTAANVQLVVRMEISGMPTGAFATHIHEGFCPPPMGPEPDQQGPIRVDFKDVTGFNLDNQVRLPETITILKPSNLPTRAGGITDFNALLDPSRNFYVNVHARSANDPAGIGAGLLCGRLEFK